MLLRVTLLLKNHMSQFPGSQPPAWASSQPFLNIYEGVCDYPLRRSSAKAGRSHGAVRLHVLTGTQLSR
jgi:hypothetical protein